MKGSTHDAYLSHLSSQFTAHADDRRFWKALGTYLTLLSCLLDLALDRRHRNAAVVLIRLTFVNIVKHARIRERERQRRGEAMAQMPEAMHQLLTRRLPR